MKEGFYINLVQQLERKLDAVATTLRLGITGEAVRNAALQKVLLEKGLVTEAELTEAIGKVIREANEPKKEEAPKAEIVTPTNEQVQAVDQTKITITEEAK